MDGLCEGMAATEGAGMSDALLIVFGILAGILFGWVFAHETVAADCDRLGGFYAGTKVYECKRTEKKP